MPYVRRRREIGGMLKAGASFRRTACKPSVSPATVSDEAKPSRVFPKPKAMALEAQARRARCSERGVATPCSERTSRAASRKRCGRKRCHDLCKKFELYGCPEREKAPFACSGRSRRACCGKGKARCAASEAQAEHDGRLHLARSGVSCEPHGLRQMVGAVEKPLAQGQGLEAVWAAHGDGFPVRVRTIRSYVERGAMGLADIDPPGQKGACEKNRVGLRRILPKGSCKGHARGAWIAFAKSRRRSAPACPRFGRWAGSVCKTGEKRPLNRPIASNLDAPRLQIPAEIRKIA